MAIFGNFLQKFWHIKFWHIWLGVSWKFSHFAVCSKNWTIHISRLAILNWTKRYKQSCRNIQDICTIEAFVLVFKSRFEDKHSCFKKSAKMPWTMHPWYIHHYCIRCDHLGYTHWSVTQKLIFHMYITKRVCGKLMNYNNCRGSSYSKHMYTVCTQRVQYVKGNHVYAL